MYRPTTLRLASAHCPLAVDFYESNQAAFRDHFQVGIAAHDVLAAIGEHALTAMRQPTDQEIVELAERQVRSLITQGRSFEGRAEPPMRAEDAFAGAELAKRYASTEPWPTADAFYEAGYAFGAEWERLPYNAANRRFRLILDRLEFVEDSGEDYAGRLAVITEYKTAWPTDESELETLQTKAQAVAVWLVHGSGLDGIRRRVVNLRTGKTFADDLWFESGGREQILAWQSEITDYMEALDKMGDHNRRQARPGIGCLGCPYALGCDADIVESDRISMGRRLAKLEGERKQLIKALKAATAESPIAWDGGKVGYQVTTSRTPKDSAMALIRNTWMSANGDVSGLLTAIKPTMAMLAAVAKRLYPDNKEDQAAIVAQWSQEEQGKEFGVYTEGGPA